MIEVLWDALWIGALASIGLLIVAGVVVLIVKLFER